MARKIVGFYVIRDGEQIGWFSSKDTARKYATQHGATIQAEYA